MTLLSNKIKPKLFLFLLMGHFFCVPNLFAAPQNDACRNAYRIKNVKNYCSSPAQFTNNGATDSNMERPDCWTGFPEFFNDVWFKFTATGNIANITVVGAVAKGPKGTMRQPQVVLYRGVCGDLTAVTCHSDNRNYGISETFGTNLIIGATYYIQVDGRGMDTGTFQLCINNYNEVPSPSSDCSSGVILCDKSPFTVPSIIGYGRQRENLDATCLIDEESSAWYKFTCEKTGNLTLNLKPVNPADDLDFVLFLLPNGLEDCSIKIPIRCMASGENASHFSTWARCTGATGMRTSSSDIVEEPGCNLGDDNFVSAVTLTEGMSYALLIQNFSNTGNGFSLEFGGSSTFVGPKAWFKVSKLKIPADTEMWARDVSTFAGGIAKWEWNFGEDAKPAGSKRQGPHSFKYSKPGKKSIRLTVETENGCRVTAVRTLTVIEAPPPPPIEPESKPEIVENIEPSSTNPSTDDLVASTDGVPPSLTKDTLIKPPASSPVLERNEEDENAFTTTENTENSSEIRTIKKHWRIKRVGILYHASDSFNIAEGHHEVINEMVVLLKQNPETIAYVEGHTNNIPHDNYCKQLAEKRSNAALNYLINKGIKPERLTRKSIGKKKPKDSNKSLYGRKRNQRVEIKVLYPEEPD